MALLAALFVFPRMAAGEPPRVLPELRAESGDERPLRSAVVRGKVVLIWYESDGVQEVNARLKAELKTFNTTQLAHPERLLVLPFADVSGIIWPVKPIARSKLRDVSEEIGLTVWGDWDGSVRQALQLEEDQPSVLIADAQGVIRFRFTGKVPAGRFAEIKDLIKSLVDGP